MEQQQGQESSSNPSNKSFICKRLQEPSRRPKFPRATQVPEYTSVGGNPRFCLRCIGVWVSCDLACKRLVLGQPHASKPARNSAMPANSIPSPKSTDILCKGDNFSGHLRKVYLPVNFAREFHLTRDDSVYILWVLIAG